MATSSDDMKLTFRKFKDGDHERRSWKDAIFEGDHSHKCPVYVHRTPPCQGSCPSGEDIRGWLQIVRGIEKPPADMSMQEYAFRRSTSANPFPSVMGRVCPAPCESGCNRNEVEDFVGINSVEQFIGDSAFNQGYKFDAAPALSGKRVAIIGGGPGGMSAAYHLRKRGHASTIFDDHEELGGMMMYGIPEYRVPRNILRHEIQRILDLGGIDVRLKTRVGKDVSMEDVEKEFDAVVWAVGCQTGRKLPVPGGDAPNCITGVDFLEAFNTGRIKVLSTDNIVCVGGGDTSIDVVSVARRLGRIEAENITDNPEDMIHGYVAHDSAMSAMRTGANVTLTSLFPKEKMTAAEHEVHDALHEGVTILDGVMPVEVVLNDKGRAVGLKMAKCQFEGNKPVPVEGTEFVLEANLIVSAIGQGGDLSGLESLDNGRGFIDTDKFYQVPGKQGHFVIGDIIRPHLLTTAIGHGAIAADSIDHYLSHEEPIKRPRVDVHHFKLLNKLQEVGLNPEAYSGEQVRGTSESKFAVHNFEDRSAQEIISHEKLFKGHFPFTPRNKRSEHGPSADEVIGHFQERMDCLTEEQAVAEAKRCMSCGMCFECDNCVIYCPQTAVYRVPKKEAATGRYVATDYAKCVGCHICAEVCPTGYIDMAMGD
ncbi:4Fe-4S ferredoxin iron-sulfur binding domain protein [Thioalkalivibrio sulfidiphilus HL-EbGr7]|uniref:4Fe-4S ferredoxin iron-sulfur binding domain protein n=1 Tax=Thioalkalivibrio sulfidiphilus (strain HL-EbGR7) TaxID=396588 RepID=B8GUF3_THISH|nr:NAD(P)-binding protein [Thioalkalivibrio sulfidiphilus]ACL73273.1 4Fe-4S ferredoxin iron-sulfur binding domain protein [Thioalkalivibrio sulfidiphilus HL-EbGr7]